MTMTRPSPTIAALLFGLALSGCASPLVNAPPASPGLLVKAPAPADPRQIDDLLASLELAGPIDPADRDRLVADLQHSDPSIWPLVIDQFHATRAYRYQTMRRNGPSALVQRLPATDIQSPAPFAPAEAAFPETAAAPSDTLPASYNAPQSGHWRQRLNETIDALEFETPVNPATPADVANQARLRVLHAVAGRRDEAARPIPNASPATQQFVAKEVEGLATWLDTDRTPDPIRRAAEAKPAFVEAAAKLGETGPLLVRNAAFCTEVVGFSHRKRFPNYDFAADQDVLLYAEVENFVSESSPQGFHTSLRSAYEIVDTLGRQVVRREFTPADDRSKNPRQDYFVVYRFRLPKQIPQGKYMLRLIVHDALGQKAGQASLEFSVKPAKGETPKPNIATPQPAS